MPTITLNAALTTFISLAQPAFNFSFHPLICVGTDTAFQKSAGFVKFTLPALAVPYVDSAYLELTLLAKTGTAPSPVAVGRVPSSIDIYTVTYNTLPKMDAAPVRVGVTGADLYNVVRFNVTQIVNEWLSGASSNNGFMLTNDDGATAVQFASINIIVQANFPRLVLSYTLSPDRSNLQTGAVSGTNSVSLNKTDAATLAPGLSKADALTLAPGLSKADALTLAPGLSKVDALTLAPGLSKADALTLAPGLSNVNGLTLAPGLNLGNALAVSPDVSAALALGFSAGLGSAMMSSGANSKLMNTLTGQGAPTVVSPAPTVILINTTGERVTFSNPDGHSNILVIKLSKNCAQDHKDNY